jgi:hypothetical protein
MDIQQLPYGTIRTLITKGSIEQEGGLKYWKIAGHRVGSWSGIPPKGCINFRAGILDLHTGEYSIRKPLTNLFTQK